MKRFSSLGFGVVALCGLSALLLSPAAAHATDKVAKSYLDWKILGAEPEVKSGAKYTLVNVTDKEAIRYGNRTWGINLVWDKSTKMANVRFEKKGGGTIHYGDEVAIYVEKGGYLHYEKRTIGVNMTWTKTPMYTWVIVGGKKGTPVKTNVAVGLYERGAKDMLIYGERPLGINLRWWKDRGLAGDLMHAVAGIAKELVQQGLPMLANELVPGSGPVVGAVLNQTLEDTSSKKKQ